jgi:hypothetical protein
MVIISSSNPEAVHQTLKTEMIYAFVPADQLSPETYAAEYDP